MNLQKKLIKQYPKHKELILENWNWYQNGKDETGRDVWREDFPDTPKIEQNIYEAVKTDVKFEIENEVVEVEYVIDGACGGLGIPMSEYLEVQKLSDEPYGVYGN